MIGLSYAKVVTTVSVSGPDPARESKVAGILVFNHELNVLFVHSSLVTFHQLYWLMQESPYH